MTGIISRSSVAANAGPDEAWDALVNPDKIKKYLFGTECITDWKVGSQIIYRGMWQGKPYEDKGKIPEDRSPVN